MLFWENLREEEFDDAIEKSGGLCVIPMGCLEKHGEHEPTGTDLFIARTIIEEVAKSEDFVIFPTPHWLGDVSSFHSYGPNPAATRGCIGLNTITLFKLLEELCDEIHRNGFNKICIFSAHGGNLWLLTQFMRRQAEKKKPYATYFYATSDNIISKTPQKLHDCILSRRDEFSFVTDEDLKMLEGWYFAGYGFGGGHANFVEDCLLMVRHKDLVAPDRYEALSGLSTHKADYLFSKGVRSVRTGNYPNAYSGYPPHGSNERVGRVMATLSAERALIAIREIKKDKNGELAAKMLSL